MKQNKRKGFTIVELVIVIAVVAVLAAVLIPTFASLVKKANNSADVQLVTNLNKYLATAEVTDGKNTTMAEAMKDAQEAGYTAAALIGADNDILWDAESDRFFAVNSKGKVVAKAEGGTYDAEEKGRYWIVSNTISDEYATYLIAKVDFLETVTLGLDISSLEFESVEKMPAITFSGTDAMLNGEFKSITIDTEGSVTHYGFVGKLTLAKGTLTEYGFVGQVQSIADGCTFNAVNATFHQKYSEVSETAKNATFDGNVAKYSEHYFGCDGAQLRCLYCDAVDPNHICSWTLINSVPADNKLTLTFRCNQCGKEMQQEYDLNGSSAGTAVCEHPANAIKTETVGATCTTNGLTITYCGECGGDVTITEIPATGHTFVTSEAKKATCTEAGATEAKYCSTCQWGKYAETIAALGHSMQPFEKVDATCETTGHEAGSACTREGCGYREGGAAIQPLGHEFDENGQCTRCTMTKTLYEGKAISINADSILSGNIDFGDKDKRKDLITLVLTSDITVSADRFCELFGSDTVAAWIENGEVTEETDISVQCNGNGIYALDIILNGYTLTIQSNKEVGRSEVGVEVYGFLSMNGKSRTTDRTGTGTSQLILDGQTKFYNSMIHTAVGGAAVMFDSVNVTADYYPIAIAYMTQSYKDLKGNDVFVTPNKVKISDSKLTLRDSYVADTTEGETVYVYVEFEHKSGSNTLNLTSDTSVLHYTFARGYNNGTVTLNENGKDAASYAVKFYMYNKENTRVELQNMNYFSVESDLIGGCYNETDGYYIIIFGCGTEIKDTKGNAVQFVVDKGLREEWFACVVDEYYDEDVASANVCIDTNSEKNVTISKGVS